MFNQCQSEGTGKYFHIDTGHQLNEIDMFTGLICTNVLGHSVSTHSAQKHHYQYIFTLIVLICCQL